MSQIYFYSTVIIFAVLGLCVGSFLNVVIYRLPLEQSLSNPPSHCPKCNAKIKWYDNIPVLSFILLGGRCRNCKSKISFQYPFIELTNCVLWFLSSLFFYDFGVAYVVGACLALSALLCVVVIDFEHLFIPDSLQLTLLLSAFLCVSGTENFLNNVYGFLLGGGFFMFFYLICFFIFKREGMGFGDVKLMAISGFLLGVKAVCVAIIVGVTFALVDVLIKRTQRACRLPLNYLEEYAFAPYLSYGIAFALFFGNQIAQAYLSLFAL